MNDSPPYPAVVTPEELVALRRVCERLAYIGGGSLPPKLDDPAEIITTLEMLAEICGKRAGRNRQNHDEPRDAQQELQNLERLKTRFIRNVSHELRTPLACIDGFARALLQMEQNPGGKFTAAGETPAPQLITPESRHQFLQIISQEAQRLGKLIEDVLDLSDIEAQRRRREPALFSAKALFEETLKSLKACETAPRVSVRLKAGEEGPMIYADQAAMVEVLRELLTNAQKFSSGQEIVLGAEAVSIGPNRSTQASESGLVDRVSTATQLYVKDRGIGIPVDELNRIFEKFYRSEKAASSCPGTGLGLSIVRTLVTQNHGRVWADSEVGHGSTFYVLLPNHPPGSARGF